MASTPTEDSPVLCDGGLAAVANAGAACLKLDRFQASLEPKINGPLASTTLQPGPWSPNVR